MSISYLLVFLGLAAFGGAVWALFWAVDAGQYDDLEAQGAAILEEDSGGRADAVSATGAARAASSPSPAAEN